MAMAAMAAMAMPVLRETAHSTAEEVDIRIDMSLGDNSDDAHGRSLVGTIAEAAPSSSFTPSPRKKHIRNKLSLSRLVVTILRYH